MSPAADLSVEPPVQQPFQAETLPRLLYIGSLTVEATSAGQMQLYRVLQPYPAARMRIVEVECGASRSSARLPAVEYYRLDAAFARAWNFISRFPKAYWRALNLHASYQARRTQRLIAPYRPEAIVTIHDTFGWLVAEKLARLLHLPLHLILHDDWNRNFTTEPTLRERANEHFGMVYRSAASRLCICPFMEEEYRQRFGARGSVLYPTRGADFAPAAMKLRKPRTGRLTVVYAGNIFLRGYWDALRKLGDALRPLGGQLVIFGPSEADAKRYGVVGDNVSIQGFVPAPQLLGKLQQQADVLFVPMSFEREHKLNMQISFPSKLAEYTALTLPLLISGPDYCSAVRWARQYANVAEVVTEDSVEAYTSAIQNLLNSGWCATLADNAFEVGSRLFSHNTAWSVLTKALLSQRSTDSIATACTDL